MNISRNKLVWVAGAIAVVGAYCFFRPSRIAGLRTMKIERKEFRRTVVMNGNLEPYRKTIIVAPFNAFIRKVHVKVGQLVKAGDPVVTLTQTMSADEPIHPIRSGITGRVMQIMHTEGEYMKADDPKNYILRIDDQSQYYVDAYAPELNVTSIAVGQPVELNSSALPGRTYHGKVQEVYEAPRIEEGWQNSGKVEYLVRILLTDKTPDLISGLSFTARVTTAVKKNAIVLPIEYLVKENDRYFVYDDRGEKRFVQIGMVNEEEAEITSGLREGDVVRGIDMLEVLGDHDVNDH